MRLIFIRHGDPDYVNDTLTQKGVVEASLLANRVCNWEVDQFFVSPLGRAQKTASYTLQKMNRTAITKDWLREFTYPVSASKLGEHHIPWDLYPDYFTQDRNFYDREKWLDTEMIRSNPQIHQKYNEVCSGIDEILADYGYRRHELYYLTDSTLTDGDENKNVVFFCHFGVTALILSYLLGISPILIWQGFISAPTSVTVLNAEKRINNDAFFRIQSFGDASHLTLNQEPISASGSFSTVFQG